MNETRPRNQVEVLVSHDLVDTVKPGERVLCTGVYRAWIQATGTASTSHKLVATSVSKSDEDCRSFMPSAKELACMKSLVRSVSVTAVSENLDFTDRGKQQLRMLLQ